MMKALPRELGRSLLSLPRHPRSASARTVLILAGTAMALAGLVRGRVALRRRPIVQDRSGLEISRVEAEEKAGPCSVAI